ncbi:Mediator of DNA damage checkpoint protein 1 [Anthophora quadrimaculata]
MDIPATQVCEDDDFTPTQKIPHSTPCEGAQVGVLSVGSNTYSIKKGITKVGRHPNCNIVLNDQTVSKIHAEIEATSRDTPAWICDLNSSNKTKLNNSFLRPGRCYELKDGNLLQFGTVRAVYKVLRNMDESLIPETPMINNKKQQLIIPGTPDSSLNNSSTLGENVSMIPGTQPDHNGSVFQYPTLPLKMSTKSNWKNCIQDSSVDDSMDNSRSFNANGENSVGKDASVEKAPAEPVKVNVANTSRIGKRSLSAIDSAVESGVVKKHKKSITGDAPVATKDRKRNVIAVRRQSENILDFVARSSPFGVNNSSNRSTPDDLSLESTTESSSDNKTRQNRRKNVTNSQTTPAIATKKNDKTVKKQNSANQRETKRINLQVEDISSQVGEESQEVEMIINGALKQQSLGSNIEMKEDVKENSKGSRRQGTRKRGNTTGYTNTDTMESSASSTIYESEDTYFEMPTSKAKRAKASKNTANTTKATKNESTEGAKVNSRPTRSTRGLQQSIVDSSVEESSSDQTTLNDTTSKTNNSRSKRQPQKRGNSKATKNQKQDILEETTSELNSSIESASILSTPNRSRKSMSSSFTTSSPLRIKHKILFTGISNNEYNKLLTKLGASQVEEPTRCSVLVTDKVRRTVKFLCALALSVPIVSVDWLVNSGMVGHFVNLDDYILEDPVAEAKFNFKLRDSLKKAKDHKLLEGYTIVVTPNVAPPPISELKSIITSCNGKMLVRPPQSWPQNAVIVSQKEDMKNAKKFLAKAPKTVTIQSTEFILTGILRQKLDFTEFQLT